MPSKNLCIRCGKERVVKKTWTEKVGTSLITYTETVCPDPKCQKIVEKQLDKKRVTLEKIKQELLERRQRNKGNRKSIHL